MIPKKHWRTIRDAISAAIVNTSNEKDLDRFLSSLMLMMKYEKEICAHSVARVVDLCKQLDVAEAGLSQKTKKRRPPKRTR